MKIKNHGNATCLMIYGWIRRIHAINPPFKLTSLSEKILFRSRLCSFNIDNRAMQHFDLFASGKFPFLASWESNQTWYLLSDPKSLAGYRAGFNQCANEVNRNIMTSDGSDQLREKLLSHLASCCHGNATNRVATSHAPGIPATTPSFPAIVPNAVWIPYPSPPPSPTRQSTVFTPLTSPVQTEMSRIPSPVSPSFSHAKQIGLSPASSPSATVKTALWRPWW